MARPVPEILPWLQTSWHRLSRMLDAGRLPHALLFTGMPGIGKRHLAETLVHRLLCSHPDSRGLACGHCQDCSLLAAGTHPDRRLIAPDPTGATGATGGSQEIRVDAIRTQIVSETGTPHRGRWRIVLIAPAQAMNAAAANALLKTLEEPPPATVFLLLSSHPDRLPPTIRSRCQRMMIPIPRESEALAWLAPRVEVGDPKTLLRLAYGAPLAARERDDAGYLRRREERFAGFVAVSLGTRDPVAEASAWNPREAGVSLDWLGGWVSDLLRLSVDPTGSRLINPDKRRELVGLVPRLEPIAGHRYLARLWRHRPEARETLNPQLLWESMLITWANLMN